MLLGLFPELWPSTVLESGPQEISTGREGSQVNWVFISISLLLGSGAVLKRLKLGGRSLLASSPLSQGRLTVGVTAPPIFTLLVGESSQDRNEKKKKNQKTLKKKKKPTKKTSGTSSLRAGESEAGRLWDRPWSSSSSSPNIP